MWTVKGVPLPSGVDLNANIPSVTELAEYLMTISAMPLSLNCILLTLPVPEVSTPQGEFGSPEQPDGCASVLTTKHAKPTALMMNIGATCGTAAHLPKEPKQLHDHRPCALPLSH